MENEILLGQKFTWMLVKKLGEGDAGEVYQVESLVGNKAGVLKRPQKSAFTGDMMRQAAQIKKEGVILKTLSSSNPEGLAGRIKVPELLDQSKPGDDFGDHMFIVIEKALGLDLNFLSRLSQLGISDPVSDSSEYSRKELSFLTTIADEGHIQVRILLECLTAFLELFQQIHHKAGEMEGVATEGLIYNDLKPEHIFWDPDQDTITVIDWGNSQFLVFGGASLNRLHSELDDWRQFVEEMGKFLSNTAPELRIRLKWPVLFDPNEDLFQPGGLIERIQEAYQIEKENLERARAYQENLIQQMTTGADSLLQAQKCQKDLLSLGDIPDYQGLSQFLTGYATRLIIDEDLGNLRQLCDWAGQFPERLGDHWRLIARISEISLRCEGELRLSFLDALQAAVCSQGEVVLWKLVLALQDLPEPNWWQDLVNQVRQLQTDFKGTNLSPFIAVNRLGLSLQAVIRQVEDNSNRNHHSDPKVSNPSSGDPLELKSGEDKVIAFLQSNYRSLKEDILNNWLLVDPPPPHALLDYTDLDRLLKGLEQALPGETQGIDTLLDPARAQVDRVLVAWERKDFAAASQALRRLVLLDPDRRRVLRAEQLILSAPDWLKKVHLGPQDIQSFQEFATDLEFEGRELRNHVGSAGWLDSILNGLASMRKGIWPADLLVKDLTIGRELPWLRHFERAERLPASLENDQDAKTHEILPPPKPYQGVKQAVFGPKGELRLVEPLDAWMPEARGSSARVYLGEEMGKKESNQPMAIKLMRMDKTEYALPLFQEEVKVLKIMDQVPGVTRLLECGFIHQDTVAPLPSDNDLDAIRNLKGELFRIGLDSTQIFLDQLEDRIKDGWIPYLGIEKQKKENSLLFLCDAGMTHGHFIPMVNLLQIVIQICDIIEIAHSRNIVYRDHKILHYYWKEETNGVYLIDWNVARLHPEGLSDYEKHLDIVQFGARGLHHILTGRAAPGALPLGPTRPEEIEQAAETYHAQWTYDDERLSQHLRDLIEGLLSGRYENIGSLRNDLKGTFITL
jgi:serine/threonine protein kinase